MIEPEGIQQGQQAYSNNLHKKCIFLKRAAIHINLLFRWQIDSAIARIINKTQLQRKNL